MKIYNLSHAAKKIGASRQSLHSWIRKGWITAKRDYRNYPVFTLEDVKKIIAWRKGIRQ